MEVRHREELVLEARTISRRIMRRLRTAERNRSLGIGRSEGLEVVEVSRLRLRS